MATGNLTDAPSRTESDQRAFFDDVLARSIQATATPITRTVQLAGTLIQFVFAGPDLEAALAPALAHLVVPDDPSAGATTPLVVRVWDTDGTGVAMCPPPFARSCISERGDIWTFDSPRIKSAFHLSDSSLSLLDLDRRLGVFWVQRTRGLPYWTRASPFRTLFHWWMAEHGAQLVHGAAVGLDGRGVLIVGRGGVGKSTTALSCLVDGFDYVGDDYVVIADGDPPVAHSLYRTAKLDPDNLERFGALAPQVLPGAPVAPDTKAVMFLGANTSASGRVVTSLPLHVALTPRFGDRAESLVEPIPASWLLGAAIYTSLAQLPHAGQRSVDLIERVLRKLPGHYLTLGSDPSAVAPRLAELLRSPGSSATEDVADAETRPLISVVIPVFNGAHFMGEAIASILAQQYSKLEIIVVDDGSTDDLAAAIEALPIQVRVFSTNRGGPALARNVGIRACTADLIAFLDVDDLWPAGKLDASVAWLEAHPEADVVIGRGQLMKKDADGTFGFVGSPTDTFPFYLGAALFRRRAFTGAGLLDPLLTFAEDTDWFARAERACVRVDRFDIVSLLVRRHERNLTRGKDGTELVPLQFVRNALNAKR